MSRRAPDGGIRSSLRGISVATRIAATILVVSLVSLVVSTFIGLRSGTDLGEDLYEDRLVALRSSGGRDVAAELGSLQRTVDAMRQSPQTRVAVEELSDAFGELSADGSDEQRRLEELAEWYQEDYITPLGEAGLEIDVRDVIDEDNDPAVYLQSSYSVDFEPLPRAAAIDDARDGSTWSAVHRQVHPGYREIADELDLSDVMLIDAATGDIVYTVAKRPDLGGNVDVGAVSGSVVSELVDQVRADPSTVAVSDFRRYPPSLLTPVAGMAGAVPDDGGELIGVLVLLFDSSELTRILTADAEWEEGAFPPGGETYLIGSDGTTRSEPRGFLENRTEFLAAAEEMGQLDDAERALITASDTTVLELAAVDSTVEAATDDSTAVRDSTSIDGRSVFGTVAPVPFEGVDWDVVAEVDAVEARSGIEQFRERLVAGIAIFVIVLAFLAVGWAAWVMRPVRAVSDRLGRFDEAEHTPIDVPDRSPVEFHRLAASYDDAVRTLRRQRRELRDARAERLDLMRRMLPTSVAERLAAGDAGSLDESPEASVVVLTLFGLSADHDAAVGDESSRVRIEATLAELDDVARRHGLEPIKVIGDEYYAACGHERPYIDHAPRAVTFAAEAFAVATEHGLADDLSVHVTAGVASGPVTVGLTGTDGLVYDVWGTTVRRADRLARRAGRGELLVSEETVEKLPDTIGATAVAEVTGQTAYRVDVESVGDRV